MKINTNFSKLFSSFLICAGVFTGCAVTPSVEFNPKENITKIDLPLRNLLVSYIGQESDFSTTPLYPGFNRVNDKMFHPIPGEMLKITLNKMVNLNPEGKDAELLIIDSPLYLQSVAADFIPFLGMVSQATSDRQMKCEAVIIFKVGNESSRANFSITRQIDGNGKPAVDCQTEMAAKILGYIKSKIS